MANVVQINLSLSEVEFVQNPVVADPQLEFGPSMEALVRELFQPRTHLIQFPLNRVAGRLRQRIE